MLPFPAALPQQRQTKTGSLPETAHRDCAKECMRQPQPGHSCCHKPFRSTVRQEKCQTSQRPAPWKCPFLPSARRLQAAPSKPLRKAYKSPLPCASGQTPPHRESKYAAPISPVYVQSRSACTAPSALPKEMIFPRAAWPRAPRLPAAACFFEIPASCAGAWNTEIPAACPGAALRPDKSLLFHTALWNNPDCGNRQLRQSSPRCMPAEKMLRFLIQEWYFR